MMKLFARVSRTLAMAFLCAIASQSFAQDAAAYHPNQKVAGTIRIWGDQYMAAVTQYWAEGFQKFQPDVKFDIKLMGSDTAMPAIYQNAADLALLGRESNTTDNDGFYHTLQYRPLRLELMNGSLDVPGKSPALVVFVGRDNPISRLSLAQLDAMFSCEHLRGLNPLRTWGQLGLTGEWKDKPIHLYGYDVETGSGFFFLQHVLANSWKLNWESFKEFKDLEHPDGTVSEAGQQIIDALAQDPYGIAVSSLGYATPEVKALALAVDEGGQYYEATKESLIARQYPLMRLTYAFANQPPGKPLDPKVKEFLRYVLSREGQHDVVRDHGYLPLSKEVLEQQLAHLD